MNFFIDWLDIEQDFGFEIPNDILCSIFDFGMQGVYLETGEVQNHIRTGVYKHKGSFCEKIDIRIRGSVIKMSGNPSRWNRLDNLIGFDSIDSCVACFNFILFSLKLPTFTRCTEVFYGQGQDGSKVTKFSNGTIIKRIDITTNKCVGKGNERTFLKALSSQRYRNSIGRLHTDGCTTDWVSAKGYSNLIYANCYIKHEEIRIHSFGKIKRKFGENSKEFRYLKDVYDYCEKNGVVRFEQKLKSRYLQRENLCYWGLSDLSRLEKLHEEFMGVHKKLNVSRYDLETIAEQLVSQGVVDTLRKATPSAYYAMLWSSGKDLGLRKRQFETHRARLRKIGIDIANPCDVERFQAVRVVKIGLSELKKLILI